MSILIRVVLSADKYRSGEQRLHAVRERWNTFADLLLKLAAEKPRNTAPGYAERFIKKVSRDAVGFCGAGSGPASASCTLPVMSDKDTHRA